MAVLLGFRGRSLVLKLESGQSYAWKLRLFGVESLYIRDRPLDVSLEAMNWYRIQHLAERVISGRC